VQEPVRGGGHPRIEHRVCTSGVHVVIPHVTEGPDEASTARTLLDQFFHQHSIRSYWLWYYTPMALSWTRHLAPVGIVYDCMDELSMFKNAHPELTVRERELLTSADLVFTGGMSLFEAKKDKHPRVYLFPSSIDVPHFAAARRIEHDPDDQKHIPRKRLGFCGVIDERMDLNLVREVADERPDWHWVMIGPVVKISQSDLPKRPNIHYLGMKSYTELPSYIAGWDVAVLPFARNDSTRFISPTKTPEYLAAGRPVVSTSIHDVAVTYGAGGLVHIADHPHAFVAAVECAMAEDATHRLRSVDALLAQNSWSRTWGRMRELMDDVIARPAGVLAARPGLDAPLPNSASLRGL
jgi:UDP-galactopyranose mutase